MFIIQLQESESYGYVSDEMSRSEVAISEVSGPSVFNITVGSVPLKVLPKDTTSELAGLFSTTFPKFRAPSREAVNTIF